MSEQMSERTRRSGAGALHGHRAGFVSRAAAAVIDLAVLLLVDLGCLLVAGLVHYLVTGPPFSLPNLPRWPVVSFGTVIAIVYLATGWAIAGRTIGMQVLGLRLVAGSGRPPPPARALLRAILCVAFPVGLLWTLISRRNASIQDLLVGTTVIYDWTYGSPAPRSATDASSDADDVAPFIRH